MEIKRCTKCEETKELSKFGKHKGYKDGLNYWCKECRNKHCHDLRIRRHPPKIVAKEGYKLCGMCEIEKPFSDFGQCKGRKNELRWECKQCRRGHYVPHPKPKLKDGYRLCSRCKEEKTDNNFGKKGDRFRSQCHDCESEHRKYQRKNNVSIRINGNISKMINISLQGYKKRKHWEDLVGYTFENLKQWLQCQFTDGMSMENYGDYSGRHTGWQIDHIRPISSFNITSYDCDDFKKCWSLVNLRPLWTTTRIINGIEYLGNLNKGKKYNWEDTNAK